MEKNVTTVESLILLLNEYQEWKKINPEISPIQYSGSILTTADFLATLMIIWPGFEEKNNMILRVSNRNTYNNLEGTDLSKNQVEYLVNHIHVPDLFLNDSNEVTPEILKGIASIIVDIWGLQLAKTFPNRRFSIGMNDDGIGPTVYVVSDD